ncbi:hypothetical protein GOBAR_AA09744 [Gossypium barbadense]|uniref:Transposase MuDR plant domain-containing protein n=1 Tax=Gossypium barbadense TaxID=3634 RepID=A0A2P5Y5L4_GOSBA|nr:hypothetical protein GOBAR_AA09744 [Gossypium barbadense]
MSTEEKYYINLYVRDKFIVRLKDDLYMISYFELCKIVKYKEINLHVEYEIGITIFDVDDLMLVVATVESAGDGNEVVEVISSKCGEGVEGLNGEGVEVAGSEGGKGGEDLGGKGVDVVGSQCGEGVEGLGGKGVEVAGSQGGEGGEGLGRKVVEVVSSQGSKGGEGVKGLDGLDVSVEGLEEGDGGLKGSVEDGEERVEDKEAILDETESESSKEQFKVKVPEEVDEGLNDRVDKEEEGNEIEYFDSDDHESIIGSDGNDNTDACKRRSCPHFFIGMLFKDGEQFKSAICKYSMCFKCIASKSYSNMSRCMQVKSFHDEHNCCICFRNRMVNLKVIVDHFEATIKDHPKMKSREIQKRVTLKIYVNVKMTRCRWAKKMVNDNLDQSLSRVVPVSNIVNNNLCEAFNFSIMESRFKNIITMLKEIRVKMMIRIVDKRKNKETYLKAYAYKSGIEPVLPLVEKIMLGRPKKNKRKAKNESKKSEAWTTQ